jgi:hypothetical protein
MCVTGGYRWVVMLAKEKGLQLCNNWNSGCMLHAVSPSVFAGFRCVDFHVGVDSVHFAGIGLLGYLVFIRIQAGRKWKGLEW